MQTSESIVNLAQALAKAQGAMSSAKKSAANPFFKSKYADLASVWDACREPLSMNGLSIIQNVENTLGAEPTVSVETILLHESGEWSSNVFVVPIVGAVTPQSIGSATTYARRYPLAATVGLSQADDDGNSASGKGEHAKPEPVKMDEKAFANHQAALEGCDTLEALKDAWQAAVKACGDDREALNALLAVKDAMKGKVAK